MADPQKSPNPSGSSRRDSLPHARLGHSSQFDDFSDLLGTGSGSESYLRTEGMYHPDDLNPFADVVSPLHGTGMPTGTVTPPRELNREDGPNMYYTSQYEGGIRRRASQGNSPVAPSRKPSNEPTRSIGNHRKPSTGSLGSGMNYWQDVLTVATPEPAVVESPFDAGDTAQTKESSNMTEVPLDVPDFVTGRGTPDQSAGVLSPVVEKASSIMERLSSIDLSNASRPQSPGSPVSYEGTPVGPRTVSLSGSPRADSPLPITSHYPGHSNLVHSIVAPLSGDVSEEIPESASRQRSPSALLHSASFGSLHPTDEPYFQIAVTDPHKIGDTMSAHVVYRVHTRTDAPQYDQGEYMVRRRYRDFDWLFNQLAANNPGVIIPPIPEKQSLGRFQDDFVESRRLGLERFLRKVTRHPLLNDNPELRLFLTSENFTMETKDRRVESSGARGFFGVFGEVMSNSFSKYVETDEWFENRRHQLDALESQLRSLYKAVVMVVHQRKELSSAYYDLAMSFDTLAEHECDGDLRQAFSLFNQLHDSLRHAQAQQAAIDVQTMECTTDEYVRAIGSIKLAFSARIKAYQLWQTDLSDLQRKITNYDRMKSQNKYRMDKMSQLQSEIGRLEIQTETHRHEFEDISTLIRAELERFDKQKIMDFKQSSEELLMSLVHHQQKVIKLWEAYLNTFSKVPQSTNGSHLHHRSASTVTSTHAE
ncbi:Vacuolar protein sorting-associated protein vps5 [Dispira simplex]|nr:Vacuolar protein sorting-associated protein vps5 [Dispira simplex]